MRFVVFILGFLACLLTGMVGVVFLLWDSFLGMLIEELPAGIIDPSATVSMTDVTHTNTGLFLVLAAAYGLLGALFALFRCGKQGGSLMLIPVLLCGFMNPYTLAFTAPQAIVGLLSFLVGPLPITPPEAESDDDDEDDDD